MDISNNINKIVVHRNSDFFLKEPLKILSFDSEDEKESEIKAKDKNNKNKLIGAIQYVIGSFLFTISIMIGKYISVNYNYIPILTQNIYRSSLVLFISYYYASNKEPDFNLLNNTIYSEYRNGLISRSMIAYVNFISLTICSNYLRVTTSTTFTSLSPIITSVFAVLFLKEKLTRTNLICLVVSLIGCLILAKPFNSNEDPNKTDSLLGLIAVIIFLFSRSGTVVLQKILSKNVSLDLIIFCLNFVNIFLSLLIVVIFTKDSLLLNGITEFVILVASGIVVYIGQLFSFNAILKADIIFLQMFYPSIILFGFIISILIFNDSHDISDYIGAGLVLVINIYNSYEAYVEAKNK